jgi:phosphoglucosamine mutase
MARLFGTDGVRGLANADLTPELAMSVAAAAARVLAEHDRSHRPVAVVGRDPRASSEMLDAAVTAGLTSAGADVLRVGALPTPAVAHLVAALGADIGVMISASHNAMPDNGIKLFAAGGHKLPDDVEDEIEQHMGTGFDRPTGAAIGRVRDVPDAETQYVEHLLKVTPHRLDGLKVVVDCANGAASVAAPDAYRRAGAEVIAINATPDGLNINDGCGSTHIDVVAAAVREHGADLGIAHDGDADRCLAVDAEGNAVDGDQIMAILAVSMKNRGRLKDDTLVATVMSNLGLHRAMSAHGIHVETTAVGDRYVLERMNEGGYSLGGEQSGHVIMSDYATTGDGLLTGQHLVAEMARTGKTLAELASIMTVYPQVLVNVKDVDRSRAASDEGVQDAVARASAQLGLSGRVLLRPSGTEQLVRVMVEASSEDEARRHADELAGVVRKRLAL